MKLENAEKLKFAIKKLEDYRFLLKGLKHHSFGFGTDYYKLDDYLRPQAELFIKNKITELEKEILETN